VTIDSLAALKSFRESVPEPDEAKALRIYSKVIGSRAPRKRRNWLAPSSPRVAVFAVVAAFILVPAALGVGKALDLFAGTPAPPAVVNTFTRINQGAGFAIQHGFEAQAPQVDASKAHGAVQVETADGPEQLWVAPTEAGGTCLYMNFANDPISASGQQLGLASCDTVVGHPEADIGWGQWWSDDHPTLLTGYGRVFVDASTVEVTLADGSTVTAPVVEGAYLVSLPREAKVTHLSALDAAGSEVAESDGPGGVCAAIRKGAFRCEARFRDWRPFPAHQSPG
jgi:hypothetical protein